MCQTSSRCPATSLLVSIASFSTFSAAEIASWVAVSEEINGEAEGDETAGYEACQKQQCKLRAQGGREWDSENQEFDSTVDGSNWRGLGPLVIKFRPM